MSESVKLLKRFALSCLLLLCVTAMFCGGALVDSNSRFLSLGDPGRQVGITTDKETVTLRWDGQGVALPPLAPVVQWLRLAPVPAGSLVAIGEAVREAVVG